MEKLILVDFNGVLNDPSVKSNARYPTFQIKEEMCIKKVRMFAEFAVKHDAYVVSVSSWNDVFNFVELIFVVLAQSELESDQLLAEKFEVLFEKSFKLQSYSMCKKITRDKLVPIVKNYKVVCFEDDFMFPKEFNQIKVNSSTGLTEKDLEMAEMKLNKD